MLEQSESSIQRKRCPDWSDWRIFTFHPAKNSDSGILTQPSDKSKSRGRDRRCPTQKFQSISGNISKKLREGSSRYFKVAGLGLSLTRGTIGEDSDTLHFGWSDGTCDDHCGKIQVLGSCYTKRSICNPWHRTSGAGASSSKNCSPKDNSR